MTPPLAAIIETCRMTPPLPQSRRPAGRHRHCRNPRDPQDDTTTSCNHRDPQDDTTTSCNHRDPQDDTTTSCNHRDPQDDTTTTAITETCRKKLPLPQSSRPVGRHRHCLQSPRPARRHRHCLQSSGTETHRNTPALYLPRIWCWLIMLMARWYSL